VSVSIRFAARHDASGLAAVHVASWRHAYGDGLLPDRYLRSLSIGALTPRWRDRIDAQGGDQAILVAESDGRVLGFACVGLCRDNEDLAYFAGEVTMLYIDPRFHNRGVGAELLEAALCSLEDAGLTWAVVWVLEGNVEARTFYERQGMQQDGAFRTDLIAGHPVPVVRYARAINPAVDLDDLVYSR